MYTKSAEQGYADAQYQLGKLYHYGLEDVIPKDTDKSLEWYAKAAKQGHDSAIRELNRLYRQGLSRDGKELQPDDPQLFEWHKKFADLDVPEAQYHVSHMYANGIGTPQDHAKAVEWLTKYLDTQDIRPNKYQLRYKARAQYKLGQMYEQGQGISQDYQKALELYTQSAEQDNTNAQYKLGEAYEKGQGVPLDHNEALKWYKKSAFKGNAEARYKLGTLYEQGILGVTANPATAKHWFAQACQKGHQQACKQR